MAPDDSQWSEGLLTFYDMEREAAREHEPDREREAASVADNERAFPAPPSQNAQRARTLGNNMRLREYLRTYASSKRPRGARDDPNGYLSYSNATLYKYTKQYLATEEGRHLLEACEVDPDAATIDHVWPQALGGPDHLFNYHVMPLTHNSAFGNTPHTHPAKRVYVGADQVALMDTLLHEGRQLLPWFTICY